jgi:multiple sugar transport system ATP-binding protein
VEAMSMGDRIAVMREGVIEQCEPPMRLYDHPASQFVGGFIGSPPMNFLGGSVEDATFVGDGFRLPLDGRRLAAGRHLLLGIRAEQIEFADRGLPAKVLVVEPLGANALVTVMVGKTAVKVEAPVDTTVKPDQDVHLAFDLARVRWMDATSGNAVDA